MLWDSHFSCARYILITVSTADMIVPKAYLSSLGFLWTTYTCYCLWENTVGTKFLHV